MTKDISRILTWLIAAIVLIGTFLIIIFASRPDTGVSSTLLGEIDLTQEWVKGNPQSKVVLVEYSDFQCPACKARLPLVNDIVNEFSNHIAFVYRNFPLTSIHQNSQLSSQAAEAAGLQGKFWEMHDILFENQENWSKLSAPEAQAAFVSYAKLIGLNEAKFTADLASAEVNREVNRDAASGNAIGVNSTPTFFLNGQMISPRSPEEFRAMIKVAVEKAQA